MTHAEACAWGGASTSTCSNPPNKDKIIGKYNGSAYDWWLADADNTYGAWRVNNNGSIYDGYSVTTSFGVRPVVFISSTATISGAGTSESPYVITTH